ncbi:MAG TPA: ABC transporter permease [Candidatus Saccharimonadales bacterium]
MQFKDLLKRSWKNVLKSKVRFILTSLSLAVGAFTISLTLAITTAASDTFNKSFGAQIQKDALLITAKGTATRGGLQSEEDRKNNDKSYSESLLKDADVEKLRSIKEIKDVEPVYRSTVTTLNINGQKFSTYAVKPLTLQEQPDLAVGEREAIGTDGIFLPESFVTKAGLEKDSAVGQKVTVGNEVMDYRTGEKTLLSAEATIKGVVKSESDPAFDEAYMAVEINNQLAKKQFEYDKSMGYTTELSYDVINTRALSDKQADIDAGMKALEDAGYKVYSIAKINEEFLGQINIIRLFLLGIGGIAILAAVFGVINTQYMTVYERTREIGIMKALGMSKAGILSLFSLEAAWIGVAGSVIGIVLSIPVIMLINSAASGSGSSAPGASLTIINVLTVIASLGLIALLAGLLPARRAAKLDPIEALRTE